MRRINETFTAEAEKRFLLRICQRIPGWVTSDMLTMLGIVGSAFAFIGYWLSTYSPRWLIVAIAGIFVNWLGDSLDGTLARYNNAERPQYGFFLDHITDTVAIGLVAIGIGVSPYASITSGLVVLLGYYLLVIMTMATCIATGLFRISFNGLGPTEIRLVIVFFTITAGLLPTPIFHWGAQIYTIYDIIIIAVTGLILATFFIHASKVLRELAAVDPPKR